MAVLPIVNTSGDPGHGVLCDGLTEELINRLAQTPHLRVVARTSSFQFKDAARDIREVGRLLDVSKVLEGSVGKAGGRIRVTVQLINVADGCHLWSERYEGELTDIFAIHEQILGGATRAQDPGGRRRQPTSAPTETARARGLQSLPARALSVEQANRAGPQNGAGSLRASRSDRPGFARALSGVADCHLMLGMSAAEPPNSACQKLNRLQAGAAAGRLIG